MKLYKQTTKFTCGPACALMVLNHYFPRKFFLTKDNELRIWQKTQRSPLRGTSQFAIAKLLKEEGLEVSVYVGRFRYRSNFWKQYKKYGITEEDITLAGRIENLFIEDARATAIPIHKQILKFSDVERFIKEDDYVLLRVNIKILNPRLKNLTHYVIIDKMEDGRFHVFDPWNGENWLAREKLEEAFHAVKTACDEDYRAITVSRS